MTSNGAAARRFLELVRGDAFQREVAQVRAKAVLAEILEEVPPYNWTYSPARLVRNSVGASLALETSDALAQREYWRGPRCVRTRGRPIGRRPTGVREACRTGRSEFDGDAHLAASSLASTLDLGGARASRRRCKVAALSEAAWPGHWPHTARLRVG